MTCLDLDSQILQQVFRLLSLPLSSPGTAVFPILDSELQPELPAKVELSAYGDTVLLLSDCPEWQSFVPDLPERCSHMQDIEVVHPAEIPK